jgi:hypothetical protein
LHELHELHELHDLSLSLSGVTTMPAAIIEAIRKLASARQSDVVTRQPPNLRRDAPMRRVIRNLQASAASD